jgi:hypothetical protein
MRAATLALAVLLAGCAGEHPQFVMVNGRTGTIVNCQMPETGASAGDFLVSRACLSACEAHGFHPVPNVQAPPGQYATPAPCEN